MANKGAVGVRMKMWDEEDGETVWTFLTAHLCPHESEKHLLMRNWHWKNVVQRLVFEEPDGLKDIYDTSYLFVFGDLNYRLQPPNPIDRAALVAQLSSPSGLQALLAHDQLQNEKGLSRTLYHLHEAPITFKPTYKFSSPTEYSTRRTPSWCDRVLWATWADGEEEFVQSNGVVRLYTSVPEFTLSDHKPVTLVYTLPLASPGTNKPLRLTGKAPFPINKQYKQLKLIGWILDKVIGLNWTVFQTIFSPYGILLIAALFLGWDYYGKQRTQV